LLRPLDFTELIVLVLRHQNDDREDYYAVSSRARGWAITSPAGCPWRGVLDRLPGVLAPMPVTDLQEWATIMTSAATHRDRLSALEELKCVAEAAQAVLTAAFDRSQREAEAAAGVPVERQGRGVAAQIGLARRESPHRARQHVGLALALRDEMPCTRTAFLAG